MENKLSVVIFASLIGLIATVVVGCAPAKWKELSGDFPNTTSGSPVSAPSGQTATEHFVQDEAANKVDILIINDNSASMDPEQRKMSERFASFVSELRGIDYRIAMTTTDIESPKWNQGGRILPWIDSSTRVLTPLTADADTKFRKTVARSETIGCQSRNDCPSGNEQPLRALELAMDQYTTANKDFFRPGVDLVAVVLSDEDEMSDAPAKATRATDVVSHFAQVFGKTKRFAVHGLIIEPGDAACKRVQAAQVASNGSASYGRRVAELASLTGGTVNSICDGDYAKDLQSISSEVRKLVSTFELHDAPREGSITVTFNPAFVSKWTTEGSKIIFDPAPPAGTEIEITYKY
jgi:hypothetical protein